MNEQSDRSEERILQRTDGLERSLTFSGSRNMGQQNQIETSRNIEGRTKSQGGTQKGKGTRGRSVLCAPPP